MRELSVETKSGHLPMAAFFYACFLSAAIE
jgi:hypothetical protein